MRSSMHGRETTQVEEDRGMRMYRDQGVPEYWVVDLDARAIERSTPGDTPVEVATDSLEWHPTGAAEPLIIDLKRYYFAAVLDD